MNTIDASRSDRSKKCGVIAVVQDRENDLHYKAFMVKCKSWKCDECAIKLKDQWKANVTALFQEIKLGCLLYETKVRTRDWSRYYMRLKRKAGEDGNYIKFSLNGGYSYVVSSEKIDDKSRPMRWRDARRKVHKVIDELPHDKNRVSTSRGWKLLKEKPAKKWNMVGMFGVSLGEFREYLKKRGESPTYLEKYQVMEWTLRERDHLFIYEMQAWLLAEEKREDELEEQHGKHPPDEVPQDYDAWEDSRRDGHVEEDGDTSFDFAL